MARLRALRVSLIVVGLLFTFGLSGMMTFAPVRWTWQPRQHEYEQMILGFYAVLGLFLLRAAGNPLRHRSLIWFTVWSSIVHAAIMAIHALRDPAERVHLAGDVTVLLLVAIVLAVLIPKLGGAWRL
jgi:hypothetical protein